MTRMLTLMCAMLGLMVAAATANDAAPALRPDEVVVVANSANDDSMAVAQHYMQRREIPQRNLFTLAYEEFGELEEMDQNPAWWPYETFRAKLVGPLERFLVDRELKDRALCIVMVYGTPFRVGRFKFTEAQEAALQAMLEIQPGYDAVDQDERRKMRKKLRHRLWYANAAVDSEMAVLFQSKENVEPGGDALAGMRSRVGFEPNPFYEADGDFRAFRRKRIDAGASERLYMVARLDGPTPEIAKGLIDKAIAAEQAGGLKGRYCIDARNDGTKPGGGYAMGDRWLREMARVCEDAGLDGIYDTRGGPLGEGACPAPAIYWGWYQLFDYRGEIFDHRFPDGAIACHIASFDRLARFVHQRARAIAILTIVQTTFLILAIAFDRRFMICHNVKTGCDPRLLLSNRSDFPALATTYFSQCNAGCPC